MDSKVIEVIEHNWHASGEIVNDTVAYYKAIAEEGREWAFDDCTVTMEPFDRDLWMFHVVAPNGKTCDVIPDTVSDAVECFGHLENGESPIWGGWENGSGNLVSDLLADEEGQ